MTLLHAMEAPRLRPTAEDRVKAALWFAERGFGVFPCWSTTSTGRCRCPAGGSCTSPGKHPITIKGFHDATTDPDRIRTFLSAASDPNYGLLPPEGVFVWDVDTDEERATLARLAEKHGPLPPTLTNRTGKGEHKFWRWPDGLPRPLHKMFGLVTRWGAGAMQGYVIGPRSVHASGAEYAPADGTVFEIATLPDTWAAAVIAGESDTVRIGGGGASDVQVGGRHDWLRNKARHYAGTVRDPDALYGAVWAENQKLSQPKSPEEVRRAIGEVLTKYAPDPVEVDPTTGEVVAPSEDGAALMTPRDDGELFPKAPLRVAFAGLLGEMVDEMLEGTDASEIGMLGSLLAFCGALVPATSYFHGRQTSTPFIALVGHSGIGRKGTAMYRARDALANCIGLQDVNETRLDGMASGEALVTALSERQRYTHGNPTGVLFEEEYARFMGIKDRVGGTLDPMVRTAFDGKQLSNRRANSSVTTVVEEPYWLSGLVSITPSELQSKLSQDTSNSFKSGSSNRWLWLPVTRRDVPATGAPPGMTAAIVDRMMSARREAIKSPANIEAGDGVSDFLGEYDRFLWANSVGIEADMTRRYTVIAYRMGMVHASVERSSEVTRDHIDRAVAVTEYARAGLQWVFGQALGDVSATFLLRQLQSEGPLQQSRISKHMIRDAQKRQAAVDELIRLGLAAVRRVETNGRRRTELHLVAERGAFAPFPPFAHVSTSPEVAQKGEKPFSRSKVLGERWGEGAQKVRICPSCGLNHPVGTTCAN